MTEPLRTSYEIERDIRVITGKSVGPHPRGSDRESITTPLDTAVRILIKEWLTSLGVTDTNKTDIGLTRCYSAGRIWVRKRLVAGDKYTKDDNRPIIELGGFGQNPLLDQNDFGETKPPPLSNEYDDSEGPVIFPKPNIPKPTPVHAPGLDSLVFETRIREATKQLTSQVSEAVRIETARQINALGLGTRLSEEIATLVTTLATKLSTTITLDTIKNNLPKRIELQLPSKEIRLLSDEPRHEKFGQILRYLSRGRHVYAVGPAGTGKSKLGEQLAEALELDFYPLSPALTRYEASGYQSATGEYIGTHLRRAIEFGGFALIDEGDAWAAAAMLFLNAPLANNYCTFPDKVIAVHPNFRCMIAANTFGRGADRQYVGRNPLDAASRNRFKFVEIGYDRKLEVALFGSGPWVQYCWKVREAIETLRLQHVISMRNIELCVEDAKYGDPMEEILHANIWQGLEPDQIKKITNIAGNITIPVIDNIRHTYDRFILELNIGNISTAAQVWAHEVEISYSVALEWVEKCKDRQPSFSDWKKMRDLILEHKDTFGVDADEEAA